MWKVVLQFRWEDEVLEEVETEFSRQEVAGTVFNRASETLTSEDPVIVYPETPNGTDA